MTKQFELSAYGVEEMNKKEIMEIEGGNDFAFWLLDANTGYYTFYFGSPPNGAYLSGSYSGIPLYIINGKVLDDIPLL